MNATNLPPSCALRHAPHVGLGLPPPPCRLSWKRRTRLHSCLLFRSLTRSGRGSWAPPAPSCSQPFLQCRRHRPAGGGSTALLASGPRSALPVPRLSQCHPGGMRPGSVTGLTMSLTGRPCEPSEPDSRLLSPLSPVPLRPEELGTLATQTPRPPRCRRAPADPTSGDTLHSPGSCWPLTWGRAVLGEPLNTCT